MNPTPPVDPPHEPPEDASHHSWTPTDLENYAAFKIANHTWEFPSLEVARMLSPKKPKPGVEAAGKLLRPHEYDCTVDGPVFQDTLNDVVARLKTDTKPTSQLLDPHYLAVFLAKCVEVCHDALDKQQCAPLRQDRWYKNLQFTIKGVSTTPSGEPVPDIAAKQGQSALGEESAHRVTLSVETEGSWKEMVIQAFYGAR